MEDTLENGGLDAQGNPIVDPLNGDDVVNHLNQEQFPGSGSPKSGDDKPNRPNSVNLLVDDTHTSINVDSLQKNSPSK